MDLDNFTGFGQSSAKNTTWLHTEENTTEFDGSYKNNEDSSDIFLTIQFYYKIIILIFGCVGNLATMLLVKFTKGRTTSKCIIFSLAVSDTLFLALGFPLEYINNFVQTAADAKSVRVCKFHSFVLFSFPAISNWLIVTLTTERAIAVTWPLHFKFYMSLSRSFAWIIVLWLVHFMWASFMALHFTIVDLYDEDEGNFVSSCFPFKHMVLQ